MEDAVEQSLLARDGRCLDPSFALPQLQPYESSAPEGVVAVGILERAIDQQALVRHQNDDCLQSQ